ncbi:heparan-alpha-glucosaminide N-acetyltransferase domain-containing protein [Arthrobacter sp. USHLN218]|uniref:heparan-alpha-glucosaminide N-acetyltransferase domain-containing protein n=1 Tax=Arthrobacter sp. USHLN218 TaxID=3081232 RepID=UPI0030195746
MTAGIHKPLRNSTPLAAPPPSAVTLEPGPNEPTRTKRAIGIDVARSIALIGMVAVHVWPTTTKSDDMSLVYAVFAGRAAGLFALLAGVSIAFVERRSRGKLFGRTLWADRGALVVRGLLIMLAGLLLGYLEADVTTILPYFGILFLLVIPLYGRSNRVLIIAGVLFATLGPLLLFLFGDSLPEQPDPGADYTLTTMFQYPVPFISDMLLIGQYPTLLWMAYICVGIVIGRQVLTSKRVALVIAAWGAGLALATWFLSQFLLGAAGGFQRLVEATPGMTSDDIIDVLAYGPEDPMLPHTTGWWLATVAPYSHTPLNLIHDLGCAMAVTGVVLLLTRSGGKIFSPFAAIGAMTLTLYSAHVTILAIDVLDPARPRVSLWVQIISFMLFALAWRSAMGRGPLEQIISDSSDWVRNKIRMPRQHRRRAKEGSAEVDVQRSPPSVASAPLPGPPVPATAEPDAARPPSSAPELQPIYKRTSLRRPSLRRPSRMN